MVRLPAQCRTQPACGVVGYRVITSTRSPVIARQQRIEREPLQPALAPGAIRVGVGGWNYEPWRANFYPPGLAHARELEYASRHLTAIEINATYYRTQTAASFAKWRDTTPDDFIFAVKASRYATNRRVLGDAGESVERFVNSGLTELGTKLGPLVWQFATTKKFEADDFESFLKLLPDRVDGMRLRHALEVRHPSFMSEEFLALARRFNMAAVFADSPDYPSFADCTADFVYARLMKTEATEATGYSADGIAKWASAAGAWVSGAEPPTLPRINADIDRTASRPRAVFLFFISGAKERAPAAAMATLAELGWAPSAFV